MRQFSSHVYITLTNEVSFVIQLRIPKNQRLNITLILSDIHQPHSDQVNLALHQLLMRSSPYLHLNKAKRIMLGGNNEGPGSFPLLEAKSQKHTEQPGKWQPT